MTKPVKKRSYDTTGRTAISRATRARILDAAQSVFVAHGYRASTVAMIADAAGVSIDTVYALVGRKPEVLRELIELSLAGADRPMPADERPHVIALKLEPDPVKKLGIYARGVGETHARMAPLLLALGEAATTDTSAAEVVHDIGRRRARNMRRLVADVRGAGDGDHEFAADAAADVVWVLNSPEVYHLLTVERGWSPEEYERFLHSGLRHFVLE